MYETMTHDYLLEDAKQYIGGGVQKGEGSLVYNALSSLAYELEKLYIEANYIINQMYADTADYSHLVDIAANRGIYPKAATSATVLIRADAELPVGWRGSLKGYNYRVTGAGEESGTYIASCEETGSGSNELTGKLTPIDYVDGLTSAVIESVLVDGKDAETQEELYERYLKSFGTEPFAGNVAAYESVANSYDGVGGSKVYPVWDGPGTVKICIIGADGRAASQYLVDQIQSDAVPEQGSGYGFASIDHNVTVVSVSEVTCNITFSLTYTPGYTWADVRDDVTAKIGEYITGLADAWADGDCTTETPVYTSRIEAAVLAVTGIEDISGTKINGSTANLRLAWDQIPVLGTVSTS